MEKTNYSLAQQYQKVMTEYTEQYVNLLCSLSEVQVLERVYEYNVASSQIEAYKKVLQNKKKIAEKIFKTYTEKYTNYISILTQCQEKGGLGNKDIPLEIDYIKEEYETMVNSYDEFNKLFNLVSERVLVTPEQDCFSEL